MDSKYIGGLVVFLILGLGLGYFSFNNSAELDQTQNEIISIQTTLSEVQSNYDELEAQFNELSLNYDSLEDEYTTLNNQYTELSSENVEKTGYDELVDQLTAVLEEKTSLENDLFDLQSQYDELESQYLELSNQYDELLSEYQMINGPQSEYTTIDDLQITLTTEKTIYNYTEAIKGTVSIYYKTGEPFQGFVWLSCRVPGYGTTAGDGFYINGNTTFVTKYPTFIWGPAIYYFRIQEIFDTNDFIIASSSKLSNLEIRLEAK